MSYVKKYFWTLATILIVIFLSRAKINNHNSSSETNNITGLNNSPSPLPSSAAQPTGNWRDGTYTGSSSDAYYGNVRVKVVISGSKITDVIFIDFPQDNNVSRHINNVATLQLRNEVIQSQSTQVNAISGASFTSEAFFTSLKSALDQAA